jgi:hypothetical protein
MKYQDVKKNISESAEGASVFIDDLSSEERSNFIDEAHESGEVKMSNVRSPHNGQAKSGQETVSLLFW